MRKTLFATDEILISVDAMDLQDNAGLDTSALLAAMAASADSPVSTGIDPVGVLAGLTVTATPSTNAVITITPGTLIYKIADDNGVTWRLATLRDTVVLTTDLATVGNHKHVFVEATVTETTTNEDRTFRRVLAGRIIDQVESTPKIKQAVMTLRVRAGTEVITSTDAYLPAWSADGLPLARVYVTSAATTATDIRRMYRSQCGETPHTKPIRATTTIVGAKTNRTSCERNFIGFGSKSSLDYCLLNLWNPYGGPYTDIAVASGYTPAANSIGYVYAYRVHPKVGVCELVVSDVTPTVDRGISGPTVFSAPAPWPISTSATGSEITYLFPQPWWSGSVASVSEIHGSEMRLSMFAPSKTVTGVSNTGGASVVTFDVADILPAQASSAAFRFKIVFTGASPEPQQLILDTDFVASFTEGDSVHTVSYTVASPPSAEVSIRPMNATIQRTLGGVKFTMNFDFQGTDVDPFDVTIIPTRISESFRS